MTVESTVLKNGKQFHELIQTDWSKTADGRIKAEKGVLKPNNVGEKTYLWTCLGMI